jgi:hypothetical protein
LPRAQKQRGKRGAERKRVERGENNGDGNRNRELLIEPARNSGNEGCGHEHSGENERDAYHRAGELFHCFESSVLWSQPLLNVPLHALHHHDGVVHYQTNRQYQTKERKRVDGKTEQGEEYERAHQRNRHGQKRDQRGTPALQEKIDHKDHQDEGDQKCLNDFLDAFRNRTLSCPATRQSPCPGESVVSFAPSVS